MNYFEKRRELSSLLRKEEALLFTVVLHSSCRECGTSAFVVKGDDKGRLVSVSGRRPCAHALADLWQLLESRRDP